MNLYEIDEAILACVDEETGEIINEEALEGLEVERDAKIRNIACWIKNLRAQAEALKAEKLSFEKRQAAATNKADSLSWYLQNYLGGAKISCPEFTISYKKSTELVVDEEAMDLIPDEYFKVEKKVKKDELKKAVKAGEVFLGVELVEKQNMQIK